MNRADVIEISKQFREYRRVQLLKMAAKIRFIRMLRKTKRPSMKRTKWTIVGKLSELR